MNKKDRIENITDQIKQFIVEPNDFSTNHGYLCLRGLLLRKGTDRVLDYEINYVIGKIIRDFIEKYLFVHYKANETEIINEFLNQYK